jgi:hypothetical protein
MPIPPARQTAACHPAAQNRCQPANRARARAGGAAVQLATVSVLSAAPLVSPLSRLRFALLFAPAPRAVCAPARPAGRDPHSGTK